MMNGLDYSMAMPDIAAMKQGNIAFVCRYVGWSDLAQTKILTPHEAQILSQNGIALVSNYEWYGSRPQEGAAAASVDADRAVQIHTNCGGPDHAPIYFSVDYDSPGNDVADYFRELGRKLGLQRVGAYGGYRCIKYLFDNNLITWGWQTYAWSGGQWDKRAHIRQTQNSVQFGGVEVDLDTGMFEGIGQWNIGGTASPVQLDKNGCVVTVQKSFQLEQGESSELCGPWSVVATAYAAKPGDSPTKSAEDLDRYTDAMIDKLYGPGTTHLNFQGVMPDDMIRIMNYVRDDTHLIHYQVISGMDMVVTAVKAGYPVLISCNGQDIYAWDKAGQWVYAYPYHFSIGHIFPVVGVDAPGNLIVADQLNDMYQGYWPPTYSKSHITNSLSWACIIKLPFLKDIPDPAKWPTNFNAQNFGGITTTTPQPDYQLEAATNEWNATGTGAPTTTGIFASWLSDYRAGHFHGPPLTKEVQSVDWNGNKIIVQLFAGGRCEWRGGFPYWYSNT